MTLRDNVRSCEIRKALNVEIRLHRIEISQLRWFSDVSRLSLEIIAREFLQATPTAQRPMASKGHVEWLHLPTWLIPFRVQPAELLCLRLLLTVKYFTSCQGCRKHDPPKKKSANENERMNEKDQFEWDWSPRHNTAAQTMLGRNPVYHGTAPSREELVLTNEMLCKLIDSQAKNRHT